MLGAPSSQPQAIDMLIEGSVMIDYSTLGYLCVYLSKLDGRIQTFWGRF